MSGQWASPDEPRNGGNGAGRDSGADYGYGPVRHVGRLVRKWWPVRPDRGAWEDVLSRFYAENDSYHAMTASGDKAAHPQVRLLSALVSPGGTYAEIGCGGGHAARAVAHAARVVGFDVSPIAVAKARSLCEGLSASFEVAGADALPLGDGSVDGTYCFETLEHLWGPVTALAEMSRITRSGGFLLVSTPNHFSLDLHLGKKRTVRALETALATVRLGCDRAARRTFVNLTPDLDEVVPDCDMIASLVPCNITWLLGRLGCKTEFVDTFYMRAHAPGEQTPLHFQRYASRPVLKWCGDHVLFLARKEADI